MENILMNSFLRHQIYCFLLCNVYIVTFTSDTPDKKDISKLLQLANQKYCFLDAPSQLLYKNIQNIPDPKIFNYKDGDMFDKKDYNQEKQQNIGNGVNNKIFFNFDTGDFEQRKKYR